MKRLVYLALLSAALGILLALALPAKAQAPSCCDNATTTTGKQTSSVCYASPVPPPCSGSQVCRVDRCGGSLCASGYIQFCIGILYCGQANLTGCQGKTCS